jgi:hypothetical protein
MGISLRQLDLALKQAGKIGFSDWVSPIAIVIVKTGEEMDEIDASPGEGALHLASTSIQVLNLNEEEVEVVVKLRTDNGGEVPELTTTLSIPPQSMRDLRWSLPGVKTSGWVSVSCDKPVYPAGWFNPQLGGEIPMTFYPIE